MLVSLESARRHTLHMNLFISKMLAETHGRGEKSALSLLSLALFRQTGKMLPSVNFHRNKGGLDRVEFTANL